MIIGIGCDIVEHCTTKRLKWDSRDSVQRRVFTKRELDIYIANPKIEYLSGRFAAKEAVLKCLSTGMQDGIAMTDIQILQLENGAPKIELQGGAKSIAEILGIDYWHISITHTTMQSTAFVIAEKR